jgi:hypothetical protein
MPPDLRRDTVKLGDLLSIAEQIQALGLARKTGQIYLTNVPPPARINLIDGAVVDAQFGLQSGRDAAVALINLPEAQSEFIVGERAQRRTIEIPYMQLLVEAAQARDETGTNPDSDPDGPELKNLTGPALRVTVGQSIRTFPLTPGTTVIGRALTSDIVINDPTVSQRHAVIECSERGCFLKDLGSMNGSYVAGQQVKEHWLQPQDRVQFGSVVCLLLSGTPRRNTP